MIIYYYIDAMGRKKWSRNEKKIIELAEGRPVNFCDISEFDGHLMSNDWNG